MSQPTFPGRLKAGDPELTERQRAVFAALVTLHGRTARAVSSERVASDSGMRLSSASIRTALAELESMGLLERSHSSSGRVPSARGYEFFVRTLLEPAVLPPRLAAEIDAVLSRSTGDVERLFQEASRLIASLTHQLGLALASSLEDEQLTALELQPLHEQRALLLLRLGRHTSRTLVLELATPLERGELAEVESVLCERLLMRPLSEVRERLAEDPELARHTAVRIVVRAASSSWGRPLDTPLLSAGTVHMAEQPEFAAPGQLGSVLRMIEAGSPLDRLMVTGIQGQVGVRVGLDEARVLASCSLVSFPLPGVIPGAVGVLGPLRMDYALTLAVVDRVGTRVADLLSA
jgi:heat-inducible transcriptional repressor